MSSSAPTGNDAFVGRDEQLDQLTSLWREVRSGESGPRVVVLLAEPGIGKTRLAQEFYRRLVAREQSTGEESGGYWPAELGLEDNNLQVNPPEASWNASATVPFLWWGIRLTDPGERNQVTTGALPGHIERFLGPHLEPFHREQRRRQRLLQVAEVGGAVAADAVIDLVPFLGLVKKVGEVGLELKGIHDEWRKDARVADATTSANDRRASLVDQLIADLEKLFTGPAGRRVPVVILVDDAQFSSSDPGVSAFVESLLPAMTRGRWPVLLLVTHWEREWLADDASPTAATLKRHAREELDSVSVARLEPIADLLPLVRSALPGLTDEQQEAIVARAGGNPSFLNEIIRYATDVRGRALFVGRDPTGAMTANGLATLLAKSVRFTDLVVDRLSSAPEAVQKALVLAGLQGHEFTEWLLAATAKRLVGAELLSHDGAVSTAVDQAASPHALVARVSAQRAAFSQRVYHEVARDLLPAWYDEDEALEALKDVVRSAMAGDLETPLDVDDMSSLWRVAVVLFERSTEVEDERIAAHSLHQLQVAAGNERDLHAAYALAKRQAAVLSRLPDERLDDDLAWLRGANSALAAFGDQGAQRPLLVRLVELTGDTFDDDVNEWSTAMYTEALLDVAEFHQGRGDQQMRGEALAQAVVALTQPQLDPDDLGLLQASLRLHRLHGAWFLESGRYTDSLTTQQHAARVARRLAELDPAPARRYEQAVSLAQLGRSALAAADIGYATSQLERAVDDLRLLLTEFPGPGIEIQLAATLDDLAAAEGRSDDLSEAAVLLTESLELMRKHHAISPEAAQSRANLADSLERLAEVGRLRGDLDDALRLAVEAVALRRQVFEREGGALAATDLGRSLVVAAQLEYLRGDLDAARQSAVAGLSLLRQMNVSEGNVAGRWHLLHGISVALPIELASSGAPAARSLLAEADQTYDEVPEGARTGFEGLWRRIEGLRALLPESGAGPAGPGYS